MNNIYTEPSNEVLKDKIRELEDVIDMQRSWISVLRLDVENLLSADTVGEALAAVKCLTSSLKTYAGENH